MTRWIGFVLGAALALAAVHRLGVCDLVPVRDDALSVGRAILARLPTENEARPRSEGDGGEQVPEWQTGTAGESPEPYGGGDDGPAAEPGAKALPGPLTASGPYRSHERDGLINEQAAAPPGGILSGPGGRDPGPEGEGETIDTRAPNPVPGPDSGVPDTGVFSDQPEAGTGVPEARPGQDPPGREAVTASGREAVTASGRDRLPAASIWAPFRSRRSAEGFAEHLHKRFGSDLEVRRAGPGVYGVYLTAATEDELADGLARLRSAGALSGPETRR